MATMNDSENNAVNHQMKLRPRRSALSDISNTIVHSISNFLPNSKRANNNKKRKLTGDEEGPLEDVEVEPQSKSQKTIQDDEVALEFEENFSAPKRTGSDMVAKSPDDGLETYGFYQPPKLRRKLPLQEKGVDPSLCHDILDDLYAFYFDMETVFQPKAYFDRQSEITPRMRTILIDWLIEVHYKYRLNAATLWLCINIMDRYLEKHDTERNKLQLVGITSLFLACKFEEIHSPQVADCVYLTDSAYEKTQILQMETDILATLDYQLIVPTGYHFLTRFLNRIKAIERVRLIASYIAEKNLQEIEVLTFPPRVYAAASVYIAIHTVNVDVIKANPNFKIWTEALEEESGGLREQEVLECAKILLAHMKEVPQASTRRKLDAAKKKYSTAQTQFISDLDFPNIQK